MPFALCHTIKSSGSIEPLRLVVRPVSCPSGCQFIPKHSYDRLRKTRRLRQASTGQEQGSQPQPELASGPRSVYEGTAAASGWPGSPAFLLTALGGLAAITTDLFAPWGAGWAFQGIDQPTHAWVVAHVPKVVRDLVFEIGISNISILLACAGWALCTGVLLSDATAELQGGVARPASEQDVAGRDVAILRVRALQRLGLSWVLYVAAGGFIIPGDNFLVRFMKHVFQRVRPSTRHKSFSFPSGHTVAVTFLVGTLLYVLVPSVLDLSDARVSATAGAESRGTISDSGPRALAIAAIRRSGRLWAFASATTAAGRVLGDVHWLTDTAAGACLGAALVSGSLLLSRRLETRDG